QLLAWLPTPRTATRSAVQSNNRRAPPSPVRRSIRERGDERVVREQRLDDPALDADPSPVDQPHLGETARVGGLEVLGDDGRNVARGERVQVERVLDRDPDGLLAGYSRGPPGTCCFQWSKLRRSSPESLHCQEVAARSKKVTSTSATFSARAVSATFCD